MTREEKMELAYKRIERLHEIDHEKFYGTYKPSTSFSYLFMLQGQQANALHYTMFSVCMENLSDDEQRA